MPTEKAIDHRLSTIKDAIGFYSKADLLAQVHNFATTIGLSTPHIFNEAVSFAQMGNAAVDALPNGPALADAGTTVLIDDVRHSIPPAAIADLITQLTTTLGLPAGSLKNKPTSVSILHVVATASARDLFPSLKHDLKVDFNRPINHFVQEYGALSSDYQYYLSSGYTPLQSVKAVAQDILHNTVI